MTENKKISAVEKCIAAVNHADEESKQLKRDKYDSSKFRRLAYRDAMPTLGSQQEICDFIACVTHGVLMEFISESAASKLLYGAQVAVTAIPRSAPQKSAARKLISAEEMTEFFSMAP